MQANLNTQMQLFNDCCVSISIRTSASIENSSSAIFTQIWNEISISEEAESGKKVSSLIQVPSQASTYITALLFTLCQEVGHVGGHAMDRGILEHLSAATLVGVVKCYKDLLEELSGRGVSVPQPCALQLWYNLKFVLSILALPRENEVSVQDPARSGEFLCCCLLAGRHTQPLAHLNY